MIVLDLDMLKEITIKQFDNFTERRVSIHIFLWLICKF